MLDRIARTARAMMRSRSGNATMMVALGIPALIGASGLAVDMAQWYMWKRELQFAVDQAAIAGAFSRATDENTSYQTRATQEFASNLGVVQDIASAPTVALANYNGGTDNSVVVTASATERLPFSSFLTGKATTVAVSAQAAFSEGEKFTSCIIAVDEEKDGAITIGGNFKLAARCGIAALSKSDQSIVINGNPTVDPGWVVSAGGIDDWLDENTAADIHEYVDDLIDPFAELTAPIDPRERTYSKNENCKTSTTRTATGTITTTVTTQVYKGNKRTDDSSYTLYSTTTGSPTVQQVNRPAGNNEQSDYGTTTTSSTSITDGGSKANPRYTKTVATTNNQYNITVTTTTMAANTPLLPGTYSDLKLQCNTVMESGIYVIDGGSFETNAQYTVLGNGVMIVLTNGASVTINGGTTVNLTAMTASQLRNTYASPTITSDDADKLEGMLIFEDRSSSNSHGSKINGNADTVLNGTIYMPNSNVEFTGTVTVTSQCLMIAANTVTLLGNATMSTFCPSGMFEDTAVTSGKPKVRLVS